VAPTPRLGEIEAAMNHPPVTLRPSASTRAQTENGRFLRRFFQAQKKKLEIDVMITLRSWRYDLRLQRLDSLPTPDPDAFGNSSPWP